MALHVLIRTAIRLRAVSLFSVVRRAKRETRKWPRAWLIARDGPRACIALTKSEEKERLLAVYTVMCQYYITLFIQNIFPILIG